MASPSSVRRLCVVVGVAVSVVWGVVASGQSKPPAQRSSVQGVWQIISTTTTGPGGRTIDRSAAGMSGVIIVTERHWSYITEGGDKPRPTLPAGAAAKATADELRAAWGPFDAQTGPYEMNGNEMTLRHIAAKNPALTGPGTLLVVSFTVDGKNGTVTQVRNQNGPFPNPVTWKVTRLE